MDEPLSRLEQLLMQMAEWRAKFLHEREWRENSEKEKKALDEKYVQIVFELGAQKRALEDLETRVKLLSAQDGNVFSSQQEKTAPKTEGGRETVEHSDGQREARHAHQYAARHHIYTNQAVYEPSAFHIRSSRYHNDLHDNAIINEEPAPYAFHHYQPDEPSDLSKHPPEELDAVLDSEITALKKGLSDSD